MVSWFHVHSAGPRLVKGMRVLLVSKACVVGAYQRKLEEIAALGVELTAAVPPEWRDERGVLRLERAHTQGYELVVEPIALNGNFHLHFYPRLGRLIERVRPAIVHIDEEPYNLATWHALRLAHRHGARALFFSWQNLLRRYPPPFSWLERDVLRRANAGIVGNQASAGVWRTKGFAGPLTVIPQFGVDPELFAPPAEPLAARDTFVLGYAGRLVPEKGLEVLFRALAQLPGTVCARLAGSGPDLARLKGLAADLQLTGRVTFEQPLPSTRMREFYIQLDGLVLPSLTRPNWQEQFGRVLIEAMACGVPVIGSTCGEIPNVIGEAGLIFPEGRAEALAAAVRLWLNDPAQRQDLAARGRARVLARFTHRQVAEKTVAVYHSLS
jgi:glycosyltransferase involved in cell wall biosynthesis